MSDWGRTHQWLMKGDGTVQGYSAYSPNEHPLPLFRIMGDTKPDTRIRSYQEDGLHPNNPGWEATLNSWVDKVMEMNKVTKAVLIDPVAKTVTDVDLQINDDPTLIAIRNSLGITLNDMVDAVPFGDGVHSIYIDDVGAWRMLGMFQLEGCPQPICNKSLVVLENRGQGGQLPAIRFSDSQVTAESLTPKITWLNDGAQDAALDKMKNSMTITTL